MEFDGGFDSDTDFVLAGLTDIRLVSLLEGVIVLVSDVVFVGVGS